MKKTILILLAYYLATNLPIASAQLVYKDVAPILFSRCTSCHHENQHAPPFMTYSETYSEVNIIQNYLTIGKMPPWPPDTTYTRFLHERIITQIEKAAILSWISTGALPGDTTLCPTPPVYQPYQLTGTPDLELQIPTFTSNATTDDAYNCFAIPSGLTQDRILRAYEIIPGNVAIVHHVIVNVDTTATVTSSLNGSCFNAPGDFSIGGYAPGSPPTVFPSCASVTAGIRIKAGSKIILQIHYPVGTAPQKDSTKIRLFFYPVGTANIRPIYVTTPLQNWVLNIPANTVKTFTASYPTIGTLPYPLSVLAVFPHSHKVCTVIRNYAYSGIDTIPLIRINKWDFNLQGYYTFKNFIKLPTGYKLFSSHVYDNTTNNPNITNPTLVVAGTSTSDEMLFDSYQYLIYQPGDENIDLSSCISDTIATNVVDPGMNTGLYSYAFPNPFSESVTIGYYLPSSAETTISIYNLVGSKVKVINSGVEQEGTHSVEWNGRDNDGARLDNGVYFYSIQSGSQTFTGKITLVN